MRRPFQDDPFHEDQQPTASSGQSAARHQRQFVGINDTATAWKFEDDPRRIVSPSAPIKWTIPECLRARVGLAVPLTLLRLNEWLASTQSERLEKPSPRRSANADHRIERIAESLVTNAGGTERSLLTKSLQEAMYCAVGFDANINDFQFITRLSRYVGRRGASPFIRRFLSLFFFSFVQFETGGSFHRLRQNSQSVEKYLQFLDHVCHQTVASVWKSFEETKRTLDLTAATELVRQIEQRLCGD